MSETDLVGPEGASTAVPSGLIAGNDENYRGNSLNDITKFNDTVSARYVKRD